MKVFKISFFIFLLTSSYHCQAMDEPEPQQLTPHIQQAPHALTEKEFNDQFFSLVKNNFKWDKEKNCSVCTTAPLGFDNVKNKFQELLTHRPSHPQLNQYYKELNHSIANYLWLFGKHDESLTQYAFMHFRPVSLTSPEVTTFMQCLELRLGTSFSRLLQVCDNPQQFISDKRSRSKKPQQVFSSYVQLLEEMITPVLTQLRELEPIHDAFLKTMIFTLDERGRQQVATTLVQKLYFKQPKPSPLLTQYYADHWLPNKIEAIPLYESILGTELDINNYIQCPGVYNNLFNLYCMVVKPIKKQTQENGTEVVYSPEDYATLKKAESCMEKAITLRGETIPPLLINLATLQVLLKEYGKASESYQKIWRTPNLKQQIGKRAYKNLKINYMIFLLLSKNTAEFQKIDKERSERKFKKNAVLADRIKTIRDLAAQQKRDAEEAEQKAREAARELRHQAALEQEKQKMNQSEGSEDTSSPQKPKKKEEIVDKKPSTSSSTPKVGAGTIKKLPLICISELGINKRAQTIFTEFFAPYIEKRAPNVSFSDAELFFNALNTCRLPSKDKTPLKKTLDSNRGTSHHKVIVNPQDLGIQGTEQMAIITNLIGERSYQTDHIRDIFLNIGVVPNKDPEFLKKLRQDGYLIGFES